jgi:Amt family ammonium transporter
MTTNTAAAAAMVAWLLVDHAMGREISALNAAIAAVVGLVAITPAAGFVSVGSSIAIGVLGSVVSNYLINLKWLKRRIADTLDVLACHGAGGVVGMIATSVFTTKGGLVTGQTDLVVKHLLATVLVAVFAFVMSVVIFKLVGFIISLADHSHVNGDEATPAGVSHSDLLQGT